MSDNIIRQGKRIVCIVVSFLIISLSCSFPVSASLAPFFQNFGEVSFEGYYSCTPDIVIDQFISLYTVSKGPLPFDPVNYFVLHKNSANRGTTDWDDSFILYVFPADCRIIYDPDDNTFSFSGGTGKRIEGYHRKLYCHDTEKPPEDLWRISNSFDVAPGKFSSLPLGNPKPTIMRCDFPIEDKNTGQIHDFGKHDCPFNVDFNFSSKATIDGNLVCFFTLRPDINTDATDGSFWLEFYDPVPFIPELVYKPMRYYQYRYHPEGYYLSEYLWAEPEWLCSYGFTYDTLVGNGLECDHPYKVIAVHKLANGETHDIASLDFRFNFDSIYQIATNIEGHDRVKVETDDKGNKTYTDLDTGQSIDPATISYNFGYGVSEPDDNIYDGTPDYDFDVDLSDDITQGAGFVRTLFDKIIENSHLSGFIITLLAIAIASWFLFGRSP